MKTPDRVPKEDTSCYTRTYGHPKYCFLSISKSKRYITTSPRIHSAERQHNRKYQRLRHGRKIWAYCKSVCPSGTRFSCQHQWTSRNNTPPSGVNKGACWGCVPVVYPCGLVYLRWNGRWSSSTCSSAGWPALSAGPGPWNSRKVTTRDYKGVIPKCWKWKQFTSSSPIQLTYSLHHYSHVWEVQHECIIYVLGTSFPTARFTVYYWLYIVNDVIK